MAQLSMAFCKALAKARREKGITQSALAAAVECKQSAISMLEAGHSDKIAHDTVVKIAETLGIAMPSATTLPVFDVAPMAPMAPVRLYCPNAHCFSNVPYISGETLLFWPRPQPTNSGLLPRHCANCGELLERYCPRCKAAAPASGSCCTACGEALVANTLPPEVDLHVWSLQRRREIAELLDLT